MNVLAYDLGGTKIAAAIVNDKGEIIDLRVEKAVFSQGSKLFTIKWHEWVAN